MTFTRFGAPIPKRNSWTPVAQIVLVAASMLTVALLALIVGASRDAVPSEIAAAALESPQGRSEITQGVVSSFHESAPVLGAMPGLERVVFESISSPLGENIITPWLENSVRQSLGQEPVALRIAPAELIVTDNPVFQAAVGALPAVELGSAASAPNPVEKYVLGVGAIVAALALVSYRAVRRSRGPRRAAALTGAAGLLALAGLYAVRELAYVESELLSLTANAVITSQILVVIGVISGLAITRGMLPDPLAHSQHGSGRSS